MRSSTSSSDAPPAADTAPRMTLRRRTVHALVALAVIFLVAEVLCRFGAPRWVAIEAGREQEYRAAIAAAPPGAASAKRALIMGNSLLNQGVNLKALRMQISDGINLQRVMIEDTRYFDWLYGTKKLLADGARPDLVILVHSPDQFIASTLRGDYTAYRMMRFRDVFAAGRRLSLSNTQIADLALSNLSAALGQRTNVRRRVMLAINPKLREMMPLLTARPEPQIAIADAVEVARQRLLEMQSVAAAYNARFILVIPPIADKTAPALTDAMIEAGRQAGVTVLVPVHPTQLDLDDYADGYHLNAIGAKIFTDHLAEQLRTLAHDNTNPAIQ